MPASIRFWKYVEKSDGCWTWTGWLKPNGYGGFDNGYAHRFSWTLHFGPIPRGLDVCHRCDVRNCVRPDHLFLGTRAVNLADMRRKGRAAPSPFRTPEIAAASFEKRRKVRGSEVASAKLTEAKVLEIKRLLAVGKLSQEFIGTAYGVGQSCISRINRGDGWRHVAIG